MKNDVILTNKGLQELKKELNELINIKRPSIIKELKEARAQQDLSENAGYEAARAHQASVESRINQIESLLKQATIVKVDTKNQDTVKIGSTVVIYNHNTKKTSEIQILGPLEADPFANIISTSSPLGQALLNKKINNVAVVKLPSQSYKVEIKAIKHA